LAVWVLKEQKWPKNSNLESVTRTFIELFAITEDEMERIFTDKIEGHPISRPFQELPVAWDDLRNDITPPPDACASKGATLSYLELKGIGPAKSIEITPQSRLNIITGDNALRKTFIMECS
jgi:hypothetical protein